MPISEKEKSSLKEDNKKLKHEVSKLKSEALTGFVNNKVIPPMNKFANQKHLVALRNAVVSNIPLIIIGSIFFILLNFPIGKADGENLASIMPKSLSNAFTQVFRMTMGLLAVVTSFSIGSELAKAYKMDPTTGGVLTFAAFMIWVGCAAYYPSLTAKDTENVVLISNLGSNGLFVAIISGIVMFEIYRLCKKYNVTIKMPRQVPQSVANSFAILIPLLIYIVPVMCIRFIANFDFINDLGIILNPIKGALNGTLGGVMFVYLLITFFWCFGLSGDSLVGSIMRPFWTIAIVENGEAAASGLPIPHMYPEQFIQWGVSIGGTGATIGLLFAAFLFAKSKQIKSISKTAIIPSIFNINEPTIFGFPVMLNIFLMIPFLLVGQISILVNTLWMNLFDIRFTQIAPWTLPGPIGAVLSANQLNPAALLLPVTTIVIATLIYIPFMIAYDKQVLREEGTKPDEALNLFQEISIRLFKRSKVNIAKIKEQKQMKREEKLVYKRNKQILKDNARQERRELLTKKRKQKSALLELKKVSGKELKQLKTTKLEKINLINQTKLEPENKAQQKLVVKKEYWTTYNQKTNEFANQKYEIENS